VICASAEVGVAYHRGKELTEDRSRAPLKHLTDIVRMVCVEKLVIFLKGKIFGIKIAFYNVKEYKANWLSIISSLQFYSSDIRYE